MHDPAPEHDITVTDLRESRRRAASQHSPGTLLGEPPEWDWNAGLSDQDVAELGELRDTAERQREQLEQQAGEIAGARSEAAQLRDGLRDLACARLWRRRRLIVLLRAKGLLD
jgi:hypothetical protein